MKKFILFLFGIAGLIFLSCSSSRKSAPYYTFNISGSNGPEYIIIGKDTLTDSFVYYETEVEVRQHSDFDKLVGKWKVNTMRRQQRAVLEKLDNVTLEMKSDSSFGGKGGCNTYNGMFMVKGMSMKFRDIVSAKVPCPKSDQENAFFRLLQSTVSAYSVEGDKLLLRDGASNILFELSRR
jgi:heat shock protein HslJ